MISEYSVGVGSSLEVMVPFLQSVDYSEEFVVVDVIVAFSQGEGFG